MSRPPTGIRFAPPAVAIDAELAWLLAAAFGPGLPAAAAIRPAEAARLAGLFDLGPRIVARHGAERLERRLGGAARPLVAAHRRAVALGLAAGQLAGRLAGLAAELGQPIVLLKGYAVERLAGGPAGGRPFVDLDALAPAAAAAEIRRRLLAEGWRSAPAADNPQHLAPLTAPGGLPLDLHYRLRGVQLTAAGWATAEELLAAGLCRPLAELGGNSWLPEPPLLAGHLAAHAIEQHGRRPATYPLLRAAADLADLAAAGAPPELERAAGALVRTSVSGEELRALFALAVILARGDLPAPERPGEDGAALLLRHVVAGALDGGYRRSLGIDHTAGRLRDAHREGRLVRYIAGKLVISSERLEAMGPASGWQGFGRRLLHPLRLGGRLLRSAASRLRQAWKR